MNTMVTFFSDAAQNQELAEKFQSEMNKGADNLYAWLSQLGYNVSISEIQSFITRSGSSLLKPLAGGY